LIGEPILDTDPIVANNIEISVPDVVAANFVGAIVIAIQGHKDEIRFVGQPMDDIVLQLCRGKIPAETRASSGYSRWFDDVNRVSTVFVDRP